MTEPVLRLPNPGTHWLWESFSGSLPEDVVVKVCEFNGKGWRVHVTPKLFVETDLAFHFSLDHFWERATPGGGSTIEELSHPISQEQYKRSPLA